MAELKPRGARKSYGSIEIIKGIAGIDLSMATAVMLGAIVLGRPRGLAPRSGANGGNHRAEGIGGR